METRIVLASGSPRRRELLGLLQVPFEVVPSAYEEHTPSTHADPAALARHLAEAKARDVAERYPDALVIGADTIVVLGTTVLGKPRDEADAERMLGMLSWQAHQVITGIAILDTRSNPTIVETAAEATQVTFRELAVEEIRAYVATGEPSDKAGAYAIQGYGSILISGIQGDYPNVVGLPLTRLAQLLRARGVSVLGLP